MHIPKHLCLEPRLGRMESIMAKITKDTQDRRLVHHSDLVRMADKLMTQIKIIGHVMPPRSRLFVSVLSIVYFGLLQNSDCYLDSRYTGQNSWAPTSMQNFCYIQCQHPTRSSCISICRLYKSVFFIKKAYCNAVVFKCW